jgi:UDP-N-acetylglucosamine transferase subunit ALG13
MVQEIINSQFTRKKVLVAPLDWGLGHTTRCIPIIRALIAADCQVFLAGNETQAAILVSEFSDTRFLPLDGYKIKYTRSAFGLQAAMIRQIPKLLRAIRSENAWLQQKIREHQLEAIISDNRYGLHHPEIPSYFITHQLNIKTGWGKWSEKKLRDWNYRFINRFKECWVPDTKGNDNLAGELSHPDKFPTIPTRYIGPLSRFSLPRSRSVSRSESILILLSGPEPQRSMLERKIINDLVNYDGEATVVRGLPTGTSFIPSSDRLRFYNHLPTAELQKEIENASLVIARSGYSTIMDLATLGKKSILIPTPGQTEQEYLAKYLAAKKMAICIPQKDFSLPKALAEAQQFTFASL